MNKKPFIILLLIFGLFASQSNSQTTADSLQANSLGFEAGGNLYSNEIENLDRIRASVSYFATNSKNVSSTLLKTYAGVRYERNSKNGKWAFAGGLRYIRIGTSISTDSDASSSFFYFLVNNQGTTTEYLRIKEITQKHDFLAVPIQAKYFIFQRDFVKLYAKIEFEFAFSLKNKIDVDFYEAETSSRESEVSDRFGDENSFYSAINPAGGLEFGRKDHVRFCIELNTPSVFLTKNVTTLATPEVGTGVLVSLLIPLKSKK